MKLMIAIPTLDYIHFEFVRSLVGLTRRLDKLLIDYEVCFQGGTLVYMSRDAIAADAVNRGFSHVLWLDADMVFQDDLFEKLVRHGKSIVSGVYHARRPDYDSCMFMSLRPPKKVKKYPHNLFMIGGCGFGCVLMETKVLAAVFRKYQQCFTPTPEYGEDLAFCERALECGYNVYCDPEAQAGHIGMLVVKPNVVWADGEDPE